MTLWATAFPRRPKAVLPQPSDVACFWHTPPPPNSTQLDEDSCGCFKRPPVYFWWQVRIPGCENCTKIAAMHKQRYMRHLTTWSVMWIRSHMIMLPVPRRQADQKQRRNCLYCVFTINRVDRKRQSLSCFTWRQHRLHNVDTSTCDYFVTLQASV